MDQQDNNNNNMEEETYIDENEGEDLIIDKQGGMIDDDDEDDGQDIDDNQDMDDQAMNEDEEDFVDESVQGFFEHTDSVYCVSINKTHQDVIATGGGDDVAYLWDRSTGEKVHKLQGHGDSVSSVKFNFDGSLVATGGMDGVIKIWDVATGQLHVTLEGPSEAIEWMEWHPRGNIIVAGAADCCAFMWVTLKGDLTGSFVGHSGSVTCGGFTPDGKRIVTGSEDSSVKIWNPRETQATATIQGHGFHNDIITTMAIRHDNQLIITAGTDHFACISNINTGKVVGRLQSHTDSIHSVAFSNVNNFAFTGSSDGTVRVWDLHTMQPRTILRHKEGSDVTKIVAHPTQPIVYTSSTDRTICVWDERNGQLIKSLPGHQDAILDFDITIDGSTIVTASDDKVSLVFSLLPPDQQPQPQQQ